tara:strand:+ start:374 stop:571 length:198 start_codon:yes stop_codon:yes gene_type:complete
MRVLNLIVLVLLLTGCSALEEKLMKDRHMICDKSESLLICDSADLNNCAGYLTEDKPIILEETEL